MSHVSAKSRILAFLSKTTGYNTLSVKQARARFGIQNVSARIAQLRQEGYSIYTNKCTHGAKGYEYRLGRPSKSFIAKCEMNGVVAKGPEALQTNQSAF
jgi:hypothetical protein